MLKLDEAPREIANERVVRRPPVMLIPLIRKELRAGTKHERQSLKHYRKAGELLLEAKAVLNATVGHGKWLKWLHRHFKLSDREAQRYMALVSHENDTVSYLKNAATRRNSRRVPTPAPILPSESTPIAPPPHPERTSPFVNAESDRRALAVEMLETGYKKLAWELHPDRGGTHEGMVALTDAKEWAKTLIENPVGDFFRLGGQ